jgi:hypothetical protein
MDKNGPKESITWGGPTALGVSLGVLSGRQKSLRRTTVIGSTKLLKNSSYRLIADYLLAPQY